jgi:hypothetical protein
MELKDNKKNKDITQLKKVKKVKKVEKVEKVKKVKKVEKVKKVKKVEKVKKVKKVEKQTGRVIIDREKEDNKSEEKYSKQLNIMVSKIREKSTLESENKIRFGWKW